MAAGFSTATLKFYCHSTATSTASGSRHQKTVLQPLAVEFKNSSTASGSRSGSRTGFEFYCHYQIRVIFEFGLRSGPNKGKGRYRNEVRVG